MHLPPYWLEAKLTLLSDGECCGEAWRGRAAVPLLNACGVSGLGVVGGKGTEMRRGRVPRLAPGESAAVTRRKWEHFDIINTYDYHVMFQEHASYDCHLKTYNNEGI